MGINLKHKRIGWTNILTMEMLIFANFARKSDLEQTQNTCVTLAKFDFFFILRIKAKLFSSSKCSFGPMFLSMKYSFLLLLYKRSTLKNQSFRRWA